MEALGTVVCVHAHPDDEAIFTAGLTASYAQLGYRCVLVTCTVGQLGIDGSGRAGNQPGHDDEGTKNARARELSHVAPLVGFTRWESLGYLDSGMASWPQNKDPGAFVNGNANDIAQKIAALIDDEGAAVVVTYDEQGFYGHPDHIMANYVTRLAVSQSTSAQRLFYPVVPRSRMDAIKEEATQHSWDLPAWITAASLGVDDNEWDIKLTLGEFAALKQEAIAQHATQVDNKPLWDLTPAQFAVAFGYEYYQLGWSRRHGDQPTDSLFGGL
jgi:LmbE family N-acetylglucosaminyl deacetylase